MIRSEALLLLGPTGSGKSPLAAELCGRSFNGDRLHHFDFGEELRQVAGGSREGFDPEELRFVRRVLDEGVLLENEHFRLAVKIFHGFLLRAGYKTGDRVILNGLPRHRGQARDMESHVRITDVVVLDCPACEILERIRRNTGGDRACRSDDTIDLIEKKLAIYESRTAPLIDHYRQSGARIIRLDVDRRTTSVQAARLLSEKLSSPV